MAPDLNLHFATDEMVVYIDVPQSSTFKPTLNMIHTILKRQRIVYGINDGLINDIVSGKVTGSDLPVAAGKMVKSSVPGRCDWLVDYLKKGIPLLCGDENAGYKKLHGSASVKKGDRIARIFPPVPGAPGVSVTGNIIPFNEIAADTITAGSGVVMEKEYAVATIDGTVILDGTEITICTVKEVRGDVDASTGSINHNGIVHVEGTVRSGFGIYSSGDVFIGGNVEDSEIKSNGSVIVEGGAVGAIRGVIECDGSLFVKHATEFSLIAGKDVVVKEFTRNTAIIADGNVCATTIVGGSVNAFSITIVSAGGTGEVRTVLDITRMQQLVKERYDLLKAFGTAMAERAAAYDTMYTLVRDGMNEEGVLNDEDQNILHTLKERTVASIASTDSMQQRLTCIEGLDLSRSGGSYVKADHIFPGTVVKTIREERTIISEERNVLFAS